MTLQRVLGIIIDEEISFTSCNESVNKKCKQAFNRLTIFHGIKQYLVIQLHKFYILSKLEFEITLWGHTLHILQHLKLLEGAQKGALILILRETKSTAAEALKSELNISLTDLRLEELQCM